MEGLEAKLEITGYERYRKRIMHKYNADFYRNSIKFVDKKRRILFGKNIPGLFFDGIVVNGLDNVKGLEDKQLFYVSNHTSMADFLVQGYVFGIYGLPIPRIVAGENLDKWPLGEIFRKWGAIYVDRTVSRGNKTYWTAYDYCINEVLEKGDCLLNYGEGTRTGGEFIERFKTGTFKQILGFVERGNDAILVPAYINYDNRVDGRFIDVARRYKALRDAALEKKRLLNAKICDWIYYGLDFASFVVRIFSRDKGNAYLYFGEPFSIRDFLSSLEGGKAARKVALARKARDGVVILENLYKHRKS